MYLVVTTSRNFIESINVDEKFLSLLFSRLKRNSTQRWQSDFPFLYICAGEYNYIRCDDLPIVYTQLYTLSGSELSVVDLQNLQQFDTNTDYFLSYGSYKGRVRAEFVPSSLCMHPVNGRLYHTGPGRAGGVGLIRSLLADELSRFFVFGTEDNKCPTHFTLDIATGESVALTQQILTLISEFSRA